ncbi:receptor-like serine/threonine-protein kinase SD1-8 isoform X1 [Syzygium oleosum]|uniref:receptor-like serine/threonine-protein kinase SD1-8 isoform X1 n=2 Tax=Syzygium oleosum TaxID=219896 RepID=UPI0024BABE9D|nr:receptor-like serine/threonine-protein kinase SD1-8 isoform X1 [Syzygium oleosum]
MELSPEEKSSVHLWQYPTMKLILLSSWMFSCHCIQFSVVLAAAASTISAGQSLTKPDTLVSSGGVFELGFFFPGNSSYTYLGIWYKKIEERTVVWVGNRDQPLTTSAPSLAIDRANLVILDGRITYQVSNNSVSGNVSAALLDSGNFVLREDGSEAILWQSFDEPSHTFLPGMKVGYSRKTGKVWALTSWKSAVDPSPGDSSLMIDSESPDEFVIVKGSEKYWTSGPWDRDAQTFSLVPEMRLNYIFNYSFISNPNEVYFTYSLYSSFRNTSTNLVMDLSGQIRQQTWLETNKAWNLFWAQPRDNCDVYRVCGSFSRCSSRTDNYCGCLDGFKPSDPEKWQQHDTSAGCVRRTPLQCEQMGYGNGDKDGFLRMDNVRFPLYYNTSNRISTEACISACSGDCSCTAYAYDGSATGAGTGRCFLWHGDLLNLKQPSEDDLDSNTIYIKLAAYELPKKKLQNSQGINKTLKIALASVVPLVALVLTTYICCRWKKEQKGKMGPTQDILLFDVDMSIAARTDETSQKGIGNEKNAKDAWLPLFSFSSVTSATQNFSNSNKLGEGGFGPVYMGKLLNGKHVAVKRLSKKSAQGMLELRNETMLIAKLQHKNLVRLLGCCLERDEKILIYEDMPNKSLDSFLFDQAKRLLLNWEKRGHIIEGIAQGLIYLHQHSRLRIVHRDLKASNILLDSDMNPKISDFGLAKMFSGNESEANTNRIVGTYGYMSPEYALEGVVSIKSDVFSFGVLLLEIISGKKNTGFYQTDSMNLLGYAWQLWQEDRALCLVDLVLEHSESYSTLMRHINVALLCVQEIAADRPTMSEVLKMLTNELLILPSPKQPAFSHIRTKKIPEAPLYRSDHNSVNDVTVSLMEAR